MKTETIWYSIWPKIGKILKISMQICLKNRFEMDKLREGNFVILSSFPLTSQLQKIHKNMTPPTLFDKCPKFYCLL